MKLVCTLIFCFVTISFSQAQDFKEKIATEMCNCMTEKSENSEEPLTDIEVGLCLLTSSTPYRKEIRKEYGINLDNEDDYEKLGEVLGLLAVGECPEIFMQFVDEYDYEEDVLMDYVEGEITKIEDSSFVCFYVKNEVGQTQKIYWLSVIESDLDIAYTYKELVGKTVKMDYYYLDLFDPKIQEYRTYSVLETLFIKE